MRTYIEMIEVKLEQRLDVNPPNVSEPAAQSRNTDGLELEFLAYVREADETTLDPCELRILSPISLRRGVKDIFRSALTCRRTRQNAENTTDDERLLPACELVVRRARGPFPRGLQREPRAHYPERIDRNDDRSRFLLENRLLVGMPLNHVFFPFHSRGNRPLKDVG